MKKTLLIIVTLGIIAAGSFYFYSQFNNSAEQSPYEEGEVSGAYEALTFFGEARTYPNTSLPDDAFYKAWESSKKLKVSNRSTEPDPWEGMGPHNRGGRTLAIAFNPQNPNTMYAGSASGGLWRSYTGGEGGSEAWERVNTGFPTLGVGTIAIPENDSMTIYIGTGEVYNFDGAGTGAAYRATRGSYGIGILKSTDGGETWEKSLDWSYDQNRGVWAIKISKQDPNKLYATTTHGTYKSTDAGENWELIHGVIMGNDLLIHPDDDEVVVASYGNFGSAGKGIFKTTDGGENWEKATVGVPTDFNGKIMLGYAPSNPDIVYASFGNGFSSAEGASWLCRSDDFGSTFSIQTTTDYSKWQGWFSHDVAVYPLDEDELTVIGIEVWRSTNGGSFIQQISVGGVGFSNPPIDGPDGNSNYVHSDAHDVQYHPTHPDTFYVGSDGGIHRYIRSEGTFRSLNGGYQTAQFYNGISTSDVDQELFAGGLQDNGSIVWNGDLTWRRVFGGDGSWSAIPSGNTDEFFVSWQNLNIQKTVNGGNNFFSVNAPASSTSFIAPFVVSNANPEVVYAGSSIIAKSTDLADSWTITNGGEQLDGNPVLSMEASYQSEDVVYAATAPTTLFGGTRGHVFVTTNGGTTWEDITQDLPDRYPMDMTVDPNNDAVAYITFSGFGTGHVYKTTDYGETWVDISTELPDVPTNAVIVDPENSDFVYVGNDFGVFVSGDGGENWQDYNNGLSEAVMVFDMKISNINRKLRIGTHGNGAYQRDLLDEFIISGNEKRQAATLDLKVFPNPVTEQATIQLDLEVTAVITIELLDMNGRLVRNILNDQKLSGQVTEQLPVADLPKGTYIIRSVVDGTVSTDKLIVQ